MPDEKLSNMTMTPQPAQREAARKRAQTHFGARRDTDVLQDIARQQDAAVAQMEKLRALRLAKEEADRVEAANAPPPAPKKRKPRVIKAS